MTELPSDVLSKILSYVDYRRHREAAVSLASEAIRATVECRVRTRLWPYQLYSELEREVFDIELSGGRLGRGRWGDAVSWLASRYDLETDPEAELAWPIEPTEN